MSKKLQNAAQTSAADKVLGAVQEARREEKKSGYSCAKCGHNRYTTRRPLGGPLILLCASCGHKSYKGSHNMEALMPSNINHQQGTSRGPVAKSLSKQVDRKGDKHQPAFRSKGIKRNE